MSKLKNRINSYTETPDSNVWESLSKTIAARRIRRARNIAAAAAATAGVGIVLFLALPQNDANDIALAQNQASETVSTDVKTNPRVAAEAKPMSLNVTANEEESTLSVATNVKANVPDGTRNKEKATANAEPATNTIAKAEVPSTSATTVSNEPVAKVEPMTLPDSQSDEWSLLISESLHTDIQPNEENTFTAMSGKPVSERTKNDVDTTAAIQQNLWMPNAIRPNDENEKNRYFMPVFSKPEEIDHFEMQIFARGGHRVYATKDINSKGWDGKNDGNYVPTGAYVYLITYRDSDKIVRQKRGTVTVVYVK